MSALRYSLDPSSQGGASDRSISCKSMACRLFYNWINVILMKICSYLYYLASLLINCLAVIPCFQKVAMINAAELNQEFEEMYQIFPSFYLFKSKETEELQRAVTLDSFFLQS